MAAMDIESRPPADTCMQTAVHITERVLVLAPIGADSRITCKFLDKAEVPCVACKDVPELVEQAREGCGALLVAEESLTAHTAPLLAEFLAAQPSWSEIPLCIITGELDSFSDKPRRVSFFASLGAFTILERPFHPSTLLQMLKSAIRARRRQYEVRDLLEERSLHAQRFQQMAEAMPQKVFATKPDGTTDYANKQWTAYAGLSTQEFAARGWLSFVHASDALQTQQLWQESLRTGQPFEIEHRLIRQDGVHRWHLTRASAVTDKSGRPTMWIGSNTDIHDQKEASRNLEAIVTQRTAALVESNQQLEAFCYSVAHDLRAPLRAQQGFASALLDEFGDQIGEAGRDYAKRIQSAATRLDVLVNDLLSYSRVSRLDLPLSAVNLREVISAVIENTRSEIERRNATVTLHGDLGGVWANPTILDMAISNLLWNALKFSKPGAAPQVTISAQRAARTTRLSVIDNGIGIDPAHHHRIFGLFHRLHDEGAYPGTGVGLAIVKRGVERIGGKVGIESDGKSGSCFWMELTNAD